MQDTHDSKYVEETTTIESLTDKFLETNNFSYAMGAFCLAETTGYPIPEVILKCIREAFLEWGKHDGEQSLDKILGIKPGKGKKSVLREEWTKRRNERLFSIMAILIGLGWKVADAAEAACAWLQKQYEVNPIKYKHLNPSNTGRGRNPESLLDAKTLAGYWSDEKYKAQRKDGEGSAITPLILWTDEKKADYEETYSKLINKKIKKEKINILNHINQLISKT